VLKISHDFGGGKAKPGDTARLMARFVDKAGIEYDPTTIKLVYRSELSSETFLTYGTNPEVVRQEQGIYRFDLQLEHGGFWFYRWQGEGPDRNEAEEKDINVFDTFVFNRDWRYGAYIG